MKTFTLVLILSWITAFAGATDPKPTPADFLALYSVVPDDPFNRQFGNRFEFAVSFPNLDKPKTVEGIYRGDPILTIEHVAKVEIETREIHAAPISGLRFVLNDSGIRKLQAYLGQPGAKDMVAYIDAHAYALLPLALLREMSEQRVLFIVLPNPQEPTAHHFLELLAAKLKSGTPDK